MTPFYDEYELRQEDADAIIALLVGCVYVTGIRENATGEVRFHAWQEDWTDSSLYWWSEGNMGCDCNRHLIFHDYTEASYDDKIPCGESLYSLVGVWFRDGSSIRDMEMLNS